MVTTWSLSASETRSLLTRLPTPPQPVRPAAISNVPNSLNIDNIVSEAKEILTSKRGWQMANSPTMYLTGRYPSSEADAKLMQQEVANNLNQFSIVGFLDNLEQFSSDCQKLTGREISIGQRNTTAKINSPEQIKVKTTLKEFFNDKETKTLVNKLCQYEMNNYMRAKDLQSQNIY